MNSSRAVLGALVCAVSALLLFSPRARAEPPPDYNATEAGKHVGETATVTDKVTGMHQASGGSIFLNIGGIHPNELFTIFIPASSAAKFPDAKQYDRATIAVSGRIATHNDKPQIVATETSQITVKEPAAAKSEEKPSPSP